MLALLPLIMAIAPYAAEAIGSAVAGGAGKKFAGVASRKAIEAAQEAFGTSDPAQAAQVAADDPGAAAKFKADMENLATQAQVEMLRIEVDDRKDARAAGTKSGLIAWTQVVLAGFTVPSFVGLLYYMLVRGVPEDQGGLFYFALGTLTAAFTQVYNFFMGASTAGHSANAAVSELARNAGNPRVDKPATADDLNDREAARIGAPAVEAFDDPERSGGVPGVRRGNRLGGAGGVARRVAVPSVRGGEQGGEGRAGDGGAGNAGGAFGEPEDAGPYLRRGVPAAKTPSDETEEEAPSGVGRRAVRVSPPASRFHDLVELVILEEGGAKFVNHPKDPGGATKYGITLRTLARWRGGKTTAEDVKALTEQEARKIYFANYWNVLRCDDLPIGIDLMVFDFGVNAGPTRAANFLQSILAKFGAGDLEIDGVVGPKTVAACHDASKATVIEEFHDAKMRHYEGVPHRDDFIDGWTSRARRILSHARSMAGYRPPVGA